MCEYCDNVTEPGRVGRTYYDGGSSYCELTWFPDDPMPTLQVKSDGNWSCVMVPRCPMCGRDLMGGQVDELETALRKACEFIADYGSCPYDTFDLYEPWEESCYQKCSADIDRAECWRRYFEKGDDSR